jgi:transposase-like protein
VKCTQLYRLSDNERYEEIREDLMNLKALNIQIDSITCDGHRAILKAAKKVFKGTVPVQRCLVHIQRMSKIWLTKEPQSQAGKQLLRISQQIHKIENEYLKQLWLGCRVPGFYK